jgi:nucleotide-binding universal stress UspA family protein
MNPPFRNVVVGVDLSSAGARVSDDPLAPAGAAALAAARRFAAKGTRVHLLTALDLDPLAVSLLRKRKVRPEAFVHARERLEALAAPLAAAGCRTTTKAVTGRPADALLEDVAAHGRDLVVVGTRERGALARNLLGSTALRLLRQSPVPVWVARPGEWRTPSVVVATIDLGDMAPRILEAAAAVAASAGAELHVLHVVDFAAEDVLRTGAADAEFVLEFRRRKREAAESAVPALVQRALGKGAKPQVRLVDGDVDAAIVGYAELVRADLVVAGSVVHSAAGRLFGLGRTAEAVLPALHASLLVLKP